MHEEENVKNNIMMKTIEYINLLRSKAKKYFVSRGYACEDCGYILDNHSNWEKNIIEPEVAKYIHNQIVSRISEKNGNTFALHKYIHHGLSSQACLFNLLGPFVAKTDYRTIKEIVSLSGIMLKGEIKEIRFEHTDRKAFNEKQQQPTSIDIYIETEGGDKIIGEFKLSESEFGTCSVYEDGDCDGLNPKDNFELCYLHHFKEREYLDLMQDYGLFWNSNSCQFTEFYQAYRLLLFALKLNGYFILIYDDRNNAFIYKENGKPRGKFIRFINVLPEDIRKRVFALSIQDILKYLDVSVKPAWLEEFKEKYI